MNQNEKLANANKVYWTFISSDTKTPKAIEMNNSPQKRKIIVKWNNDSSPVFALNFDERNTSTKDSRTRKNKGNSIISHSGISII
jgi:hypothetical protein